MLEITEYSLESLAKHNFNTCYFNASTPTIKVPLQIPHLCLKQLQSDLTKVIMHLCHENKEVKARKKSPGRTDARGSY